MTAPPADRPRPAPLGLRDGFLDLVLGAACAGCGRPGRALCPGCARALGAAARGGAVHSPHAHAAGAYDAALRDLVIAHKERRVLGLARPLGALLAEAVAAVLAEHRAQPHDAVLLVPVPSRRASVRQRGHDPTAALTRHAARTLARDGRPTRTAALLRLRPGVVDQGGLDAPARAANLDGAMAVVPRALARAARGERACHVVLCDDVVTTGATLVEGRRALAAVGVDVLGAAVVAATPRRGNLRVC